MSLSIGIVGLPNVGKSTLFNALTDNNILAANYPFATIEPNTGIVPIPDPRLDVLEKFYNSKKKTHATVTFVDIAGLVAGASHGEGLGNQFLANIRSCNAIAHIVRAFSDPNVLTDEATGKHDPAQDIEIINTELVLADLQTVEKRLPVIEKEAKANPKMLPYADFMRKAKQLLDEGKLLSEGLSIESKEHREWLQKELQLLTLKPVIYVFNVDEETLQNAEVKKKFGSLAGQQKAVFICAKLEDELRSLDEADRIEMLASYGQTESGLVQLIHAAYDTLGLQSYLTAGPDEVRAWTITQGSTAPQAAGVIHTDFERGFIAAQVVDYDDLISAGSEQAARSLGKIRTEGKSYIMKPNDIVEFRFNV